MANDFIGRNIPACIIELLPATKNDTECPFHNNFSKSTQMEAGAGADDALNI